MVVKVILMITKQKCVCGEYLVLMIQTSPKKYPDSIHRTCKHNFSPQVVPQLINTTIAVQSNKRKEPELNLLHWECKLIWKPSYLHSLLQ